VSAESGVLKGIYLTLMIGPAVPVPAPQEVLDALTQIVVTSKDKDPSGFQLSFTLSNKSPLHTFFLIASGNPYPVLRVIIAVTVNGSLSVLIDGVVTNQEVAPGSEAGHSTLTLTGEDLTALMNREEVSGSPYPAMPREGRVALILAKYAMFGVVPKIIPSVSIDVELPTEKIPAHHGTDLQYLKQMAKEVGYVFYLEPGPTPGTTFGYWGPQIKVGVPQPALNINMDAFTNVESLTFNFDGQMKKLPIVQVINETAKTSIQIPIPPITPLNPPLGLIPPITTGTDIIVKTIKLSVAQAVMRGLAIAAERSDVVTGSGSLDAVRYGRVLQPRQLVGVRGAGPAFDGLHYVKSVTHTIKPGSYKQSFQLSRNGLVSTVPMVPA
jgi:hypothetical protein